MDYERTCKICGKKFITFKRNKYVCSLECQRNYNRIYMRELMRKKRSEKVIEYDETCVVCKKVFKVKKLRAGDVVCFDCRLNKRKRFEVDYTARENAGELIAQPLGEYVPVIDPYLNNNVEA